MDLRQQVIQILAAARDDIRQKMQSQGVNASGRTSASIQVRETEHSVQLVGGNNATHSITVCGIALRAYNTAPIPTLQTGTAPWSSRPQRVPFWFAAHIYQWTIDKALRASDERERLGMSYAIAKKIINQGTERYRSPIDIYTTISQRAISEVKQQVKQSVVQAAAMAIRVE